MKSDQIERVERIFSHAVNLQQSGRLRSTIYCRKTCVYIFNQDHTVLMKFPLNRWEQALFAEPVSFYANDYDSSNFKTVDGKVVFEQRHGDFIRKKSCKAPGLKGKQVAGIFDDLWAKAPKKNWVTLPKEFLNCLDMDLSHVEFKGKNKQLICYQRNIYTGSVSCIIKGQVKAKSLFSEPPQVADFPILGLRTNDFVALFDFNPSIDFDFTGKDVVAFKSSEAGIKFTGVLSRCVYDQIGVEHGRQKS